MRRKQRFLGALLAVVACGAPANARAEMVLEAPGRARSLPPVPDARDLDLTADEWARIQAGEIIVQIRKRSDEDRGARAIGYVKSSPVAMFEVATDSVIAESFDEIEDVEIYERSPLGKRFRVVLDVAWFLPRYEFVSVAGYNEAGTAQSFGQLEGDFQRNDGTHNYLWDPARQETLAVVTFDFALKGILSLVPESFVLRLASKNLPEAIHRLDTIAQGFATTEPARAEALRERWTALRPRLEAGELPGLLWTGPPPPVSAAAKPAVAAP